MSGRDVNVYSSKPFFSVRWDFSHGGKGGGVCGMDGCKNEKTEFLFSIFIKILFKRISILFFSKEKITLSGLKMLVFIRAVSAN